MIRENNQDCQFLQELEATNDKILDEIRIIARLSDITLGIDSRNEPLRQRNIGLYHQMCRTIDRLRHEVLRQVEILDTLKEEATPIPLQRKYSLGRIPMRRLGQG